MSKFETEARKIVDALGLKWGPLAGKFSVNTKEIGDSTRKLSVCEAFRVARRENLVFRLSKENCVCPGGRHFIGLESLSLETIAAT